MNTPRSVRHRYADPLDVLWIEIARRVGYQVERSDDCFASITPDGAMILGTAETLDPDDCLAQMVFHELCHSLVEGPEGLGARDWGLDNESDRDVRREHATLRLQAALTAPLGLREVLAPTTDFRAFYDALPDEPLSCPPEEPRDPSTQEARAEIALALAALARVDEPPWGPHVREGLSATRAIVDAVAPYATAPSLFATYARVASTRKL